MSIFTIQLTCIKKLLIISSFIVNLPVGAQNIIPRFESLTVNDGLPHSSVYSILQDKKGFMWFGTPDGLCRYDGKSLTPYRYKLDDKNGTVNNFVRGKIHEDKTGNIWYSNETGIYKWDAFKQKIIAVVSFTSHMYANMQFFGIQLDEDANLWMTILPKGLARYNIKSGQIEIFPLPVSTLGASIQESFSTVDAEGNIWLRVQSGTNSFIKFNKKTHLFAKEFLKDSPHAIFFDNKKKILSYEDKLVFQFHGKQEKVIIPKTVNGNKTSFISFAGISDFHHRIWLTARGNGLFYYSEDEKAFREFHHDNSKIKSLPFDLTTCLFIDRSDNLWVGIDGGGVAKIDLKQPKFYLFPLSEGDYPVLQDYFTKCFYEDERKRIWFGSQNNGFSIYDPSTTTLKNYRHDPSKPNSLSGNSVAAIFKDTKANMWIATNAGISIFTEATGKFTPVPIRNLPRLYPKINLFAYKMLELKNGDYILATIIGLITIKKTKAGGYTGMNNTGKSFLQSTSTDIVEMDDNTLFATLPGSGLYHMKHKQGDFDTIKSYFHGLDLRSIRRDELNKDLVWIGSGKGLIEFNTISSQFTIWDDKKGLANSYVYGSLEDEKHNLWISTNGGLSYLDRATNHIDNYSYQDGLQSNEFNTQAFYKSKTNTFYFGGIKGFNWFQSKPFTTDQHKPQAAITQIEVDNTLFGIDSVSREYPDIRLPYYKNDLNFKFAALDYTRPEANRIQYKLDGWDANWITTFERSARYANLPPGTYTMMIKASNAAGIWSGEERVRVVIAQPFWQRDWFNYGVIFLCIVFIVLLTYTIAQQKVQRQLRKLEKQAAIDAERNRISKDMHDEIGNGLTHIALLSELIQTQHKPGADIKRDIHSISTSAGKLVQTMSEIIWALSPQNDTLDNLVAYIREQSQKYFEGMNVLFSIDFPDTLPETRLTNEQRRNLFLVTKEALANALKHANASAIHLSLVITDVHYCFNVHDNGTGIPNNHLKVGSNGLKNMKERMTDIGGTIEWIKEEAGTRVEYCLPF